MNILMPKLTMVILLHTYYHAIQKLYYTTANHFHCNKLPLVSGRYTGSQSQFCSIPHCF